MSKPAAILDIDGTLVDTNYQHAIAWYRAFLQSGKVLPLWRIHRLIGMGGDQLVASLLGEEFDAEHGDDVRAAEKVLYMALIDEVRPFADARALLHELRARPAGSPTVVAEAWLLGALGEIDDAFEVLARAEEEFQANLFMVGVPAFDAVSTSGDSGMTPTTSSPKISFTSPTLIISPVATRRGL